LAENTLCVDESVFFEQKSSNIALLVPGASCKGKDWGVQNYLRLAADFLKKGWKPIFLLGPMEKELYLAAVENAGFSTMLNAPLTSIAAQAFFGKYSPCLAVGNDTGIMHLIRACGCRSVTICYADTFLTWAPYRQDRHQVIHASCADYETCRGCIKRDCARDFTYERVFQVVSTYLA
jgi:ADP-heptose:LPS heptosyltransferase